MTEMKPRDSAQADLFPSFEMPVLVECRRTGWLLDPIPFEKFREPSFHNDLMHKNVVGGRTVENVLGPLSAHSCSIRAITAIPWELEQSMRGCEPISLPFWPRELHNFRLAKPLETHLFQSVAEAPPATDNVASESSDENGEDGVPSATRKRRLPSKRLLLFLRFKSLLALGSDMKAALRVAAQILESVSPGLCAAFENAVEFDVPSRKQMAHSEVDLDMSQVIWARYLYKRGFVSADSLLIDASEQGKRQYLCSRVDQLVVPPGTHPVDRQTLDRQSYFKRRIETTGCLAHGEADLMHNLQVCIHKGRLLSGSNPECWQRYRYSKRGLCSDQGTEKRARRLSGHHRSTLNRASSS